MRAESLSRFGQSRVRCGPLHRKHSTICFISTTCSPLSLPLPLPRDDSCLSPCAWSLPLLPSMSHSCFDLVQPSGLRNSTKDSTMDVAVELNLATQESFASYGLAAPSREVIILSTRGLVERATSPLSLYLGVIPSLGILMRGNCPLSYKSTRRAASSLVTCLPIRKRDIRGNSVSLMLHIRQGKVPFASSVHLILSSTTKLRALCIPPQSSSCEVPSSSMCWSQPFNLSTLLTMTSSSLASLFTFVIKKSQISDFSFVDLLNISGIHLYRLET